MGKGKKQTKYLMEKRQRRLNKKINRYYTRKIMKMFKMNKAEYYIVSQLLRYAAERHYQNKQNKIINKNNQ